ncbi:hypothetical protein [Hymenobacter algoricola]
MAGTSMLATVVATTSYVVSALISVVSTFGRTFPALIAAAFTPVTPDVDSRSLPTPSRCLTWHTTQGYGPCPPG